MIVLPAEVAAHPVTRVELYPRLVGVDLHDDARLGGRAARGNSELAQLLVQYIGVVIATCPAKLVGIRVNTLADEVGRREVHGRTCYCSGSTIRDSRLVSGEVFLGEDL